MRYTYITFFTLIIVALASGQGNYTCVGNPYFTSPYMPNPVTLIFPDKAALDASNITYNPTTQIYNFSSYNNLTLCEGLKTTGSCCTPDVLTRNAQSFKDLLNLASNETLNIFDKRANELKTFGKNLGKLTSNAVNLASRLHSDGFKILLSAKSVLSNQTMLDKILAIVNSTDLNAQINNLINSPNISEVQIFALRREILSLEYRVLNAISDLVGIKKADIAELFAAIKLLFENSSDFSKIVYLWNPFPRVNSTLYSDTMDALLSIFAELIQRSVIITMNVATPEVAANSKILDSSGNLTLVVPYLLDSRNLESIAKAILVGMGNATNDTEAFKNVLKNKDRIYKSINDTLITNMTNLTDFQTGGDLVNVKTLFITLGKFTFDDALKKVVSVAKHKKKCLKYVFQYQGFVGCLACDPSAVALGKIELNRDVNTFDTIISEAFGNKMFKKGKCSAYYRDVVFMDLFIWRNRILKKLYENHQKAQIDVTQVDADPLNATLPSNKSIELANLLDCSSEQSRCDNIRDLFIDSIGPKVSFLCDYNLEDCNNLDAIRATRNPFMNKNNTSRLQDYDNSFGTVSFVSGITNDVSKEQVGFKTKPHFTIPTDLIANITVDTTQESDKETGSIAGNISGFATYPGPHSVGAFRLKLTVGAWLILAAIISTLL